MFANRDIPVTKMAIVIGIDYRGSSVALGGCEVDATRMNAFFQRAGYATTLLTATAAVQNPLVAPTRQNIIAAINSVARNSALQKFALFYAGHGTQVRDASGDEVDGLDEALVCQSARGQNVTPGFSDLLIDDDLIALLRANFAARDIECTLMFDACHSGTMLDLAWEVGTNKTLRLGKGYSAQPGDKMKMLCFSGAQDYQCALEAGSGGGMMTNEFLKCVARGTLTVGAFYDQFATLGCQKPGISASFPIDMSSIFATTMIAGPAMPRIGATRALSWATVRPAKSHIPPQNYRFIPARSAHIAVTRTAPTITRTVPTTTTTTTAVPTIYIDRTAAMPLAVAICMKKRIRLTTD